MPPSSPSTQISFQQLGSDKKRLFLVFIIAVVLIISWVGTIDKTSSKYLDDSLFGALATYGTARLVNAGVSVLQTTTVEASVSGNVEGSIKKSWLPVQGSVGAGGSVGGSVSIGQILDPINDAVERLSNVMTIAIGSIILQKTLLAITSSTLFKVCLTLSGLVLIISLYIKESPYIQVLSKLFIFLAFIRLSLGFMLLLNLAVDQSYLSEQTSLNHKQIETLASDIDKINAKNEADAEAEAEAENKIEAEINELTNQEDTLNTELILLLDESKELSTQAETKEAELAQAKSKLDFIDQYNPLFNNKELDRIKTSLSEIEDSRDSKLDKIANIEEQLEEIKDGINEKRNGPSGPLNAVMDKMDNMISATTETIGNLYENVKNAVSALLNAMILFTMKTVIFPVLFMYLITKGFKLIWGIDVRTLIKPEYKTLKNP